MRSYLKPLFYILAFLTVAFGAEFHPGHPAVHQMALWHRSHPVHGAPALIEEQASTEHDQEMMNMSTGIVNYGTEYAGVIGVGTNAEGGAQSQARVVFDTGSTNLWVASALCKRSPCSEKRALEFYDPKKSTTQESFMEHTDYLESDNDIDIHFGSGELIGPLHVDNFHVGPFELKKQPFAMIRVMNGNTFRQFPFEGIVGLGFPDMSFGGITPFFDRVIGQKVLKNNEFAFFMNVDSNKPSALMWGGIDKDLYHGKIRMFPVVQPHYWSLELIDFKVGNTSMSTWGPDDDRQRVKHVIVDSGTTFFTAPPGLYQQVAKHFPAADCDKVSDYPPLTYVLRGADGENYDLVVTHESYMLESVINNKSHCRPAFQQLPVNQKFGPAMFFGEVFMKHFFTVFSRGDGDVKNAKVGFAPANINATPKVKPTEKAGSFLETSKSSSWSVSLDSQAHMRKASPHQSSNEDTSP
jgi:pepsin A